MRHLVGPAAACAQHDAQRDSENIFNRLHGTYAVHIWQRTAVDYSTTPRLHVVVKFPPSKVSPFTRAGIAPLCLGLEVADAKGSPAVSDGFKASLVSPPGKYMKDDHKGKPGVAPWFSFMARLTNDGYKLMDESGNLSMFEVYSGQGGDENVTMYTTVANPVK